MTTKVVENTKLSLLEVDDSPRVTLDGKRHYDSRYGIFPSITTVLSCRNTGWVERWKANVGEEKAAKVSKKAASIGTGLHELCEKHLLNEDISKELMRSLPEIKIRFTNFKSFLDDISEVYLLEAPLASSYLKVAGTVDCFGVYKGKPYVIDFKTSSKVKQPEDIKGYFAQATFYAYAIAEMYNLAVPDILIAFSVNGVKEPLIYTSKPKDHLHYLIESINMYKRGEHD